MDYFFYSISRPKLFSRTYHFYREAELILTAEPRSFFSGSYLFYDPMEHVVLELKRLFSFFQFKYHIIEEGMVVAEIVRNAFGRTYVLRSAEKELTTKGNIWGTEYTIRDGEQEIAKITREPFSFKANYKAGIQEGYNDLHILALILAISLIRVRKNNN